MRKFARFSKGEVVEIIDEKADISKEWHPDFLAQLVEITDLDPEPGIGWSRSQQGVFAPPVPLEPSRSQQFAAALRDGCQIVSNGTPALNGTYDAAGPRWEQMKGELQYIAGFGEFSGGLTELDWPARSGEIVFSTADQFKAAVRAIADWLTGWQRFVDGKTEEPPALPVTIA